MNLLALFLATIPSQSSLLIFPEMDYEGPGASGAPALLSNPAGLWGSGTEVMAAGGLWFTDARLTLLGLRQNSWGLRASFLDYGQVEFQDETPDDEPGPMFRPYTFEFSLYRAFLVEKSTRVGVGFGYLHQRIYDHGYTDYHISMGIIHCPPAVPGLSVSLGIRNLGLDKLTDLAKESLPTQYFAGVSYARGPWAGSLEWTRITKYDTLGSYLSLNPLGTELRLRASYTLNKILTPSVLYSYGREIDPLEFRLGAKGGNMIFSYGFRPSFLGFDPLHMVSVRYLVGG